MRKKPISNHTLNPVRLIAKGHDPMTDRWYRVLEFSDPNGKSRDHIVPFGATESDLWKGLGDKGFDIPMSRPQRHKILKDIEAQKPERIIQVLTRLGWNQEQFVLPEGVLGVPSSESRVAITELPKDHYIRTSGTLEEWQQHVAEPAVGNRLIQFAISLAFAPTLLSLAKMESGGFNLFASSSKGKTTTAIVAGSVWGGGGPKGFAQSWLATENSWDLLALRHNDMLLILDETGLANEGEKRKHEPLFNAAYRLSQGYRKHRFGDQDQDSVTWRTLFLSTSEKALVDMAVEGGRSLQPGQIVRFTDIDADAGQGMGTFENIHDSERPDKFAKALDRAANDYYGTPSQHFLKRLVGRVEQDRQSVEKWIGDRMSFYRKKAHRLVSTETDGRIADRFALVYAAGAMTADFKIVPWDRKACLKAVLFAHERAVQVQSSGPTKLPQILDRLREMQAALCPIHVGSKKVPQSSAGYAYTNSRSETELLFDREQFQAVLPVGVTLDQARQVLNHAGLLNRQKGGKLTVTRNLPNPVGRKRFTSIKATALDL